MRSLSAPEDIRGMRLRWSADDDAEGVVGISYLDSRLGVLQRDKVSRWLVHGQLGGLSLVVEISGWPLPTSVVATLEGSEQSLAVGKRRLGKFQLLIDGSRAYSSGIQIPGFRRLFWTGAQGRVVRFMPDMDRLGGFVGIDERALEMDVPVLTLVGISLLTFSSMRKGLVSPV